MEVIMTEAEFLQKILEAKKQRAIETAGIISDAVVHRAAEEYEAMIVKADEKYMAARNAAYEEYDMAVAQAEAKYKEELEKGINNLRQ